MPDLHVTDRIALLNPNSTGPGTIDPYDEDTFKDLWRIYTLPYRIPPGQPALLCTRENVSIPLDHVGDIYLRSTLARLALACATTVADPGFKGQLTLEIINMTNRSFMIHPYDRLFHIIIKPCVDEPPYDLSGRYQYQSGITFPKALTP